MRHYRAAEITSTSDGDHFRRMVLEEPDIRTGMLGFEAGPGDLVLVEPGGFHEFTVHAEPLVVLAVVAPNLDDAEMG